MSCFRRKRIARESLTTSHRSWSASILLPACHCERDRPRAFRSDDVGKATAVCTNAQAAADDSRHRRHGKTASHARTTSVPRAGVVTRGTAGRRDLRLSGRSPSARLPDAAPASPRRSSGVKAGHCLPIMTGSHGIRFVSITVHGASVTFADHGPKTGGGC